VFRPLHGMHIPCYFAHQIHSRPNSVAIPPNRAYGLVGSFQIFTFPPIRPTAMRLLSGDRAYPDQPRAERRCLKKPHRGKPSRLGLDSCSAGAVYHQSVVSLRAPQAAGN